VIDAVTGYRRALATAGHVVDGVTDWSAPTPCPPWDARMLSGHLIDGQRQVLAMLTGAPHVLPTSDPSGLAAIAGQAPAEAWRAAAHRVDAVLDDLDAAAVVRTPAGDRRVEEVLAIAVIEPLVHGWDLAVASAQGVVLDPDVVATTLAGVEQLGGALAASGMYAPGKQVPEGATPQRRLLTKLGRDP
jgi:uncharacterized protein (TIGR03086 family)